MEWFIKANLNLAVFYLFYLLIIRFSGRHFFARFYLLVTPVVSVLLPLIKVSGELATNIPQVYLETLKVSTLAAQQQEWSMVVWSLLPQLYFTGVIFSLIITGISIVRLLWKRSHVRTAYSFFKHIYLPDVSEEKSAMMLLHEEAHVKQWHSLDTLWYALVRAFFWINPVVYKLFRCLKEAHEYSADAYALQQIGDRSSYCELLLDETFGVSNISALSHSFHSNISLLNRIKMITQTQPQSVAWWKRIASVPLLGMLFFVSVLGTSAFAQKVEGKIYGAKELPEKMPEFQGGQEAMMKFLLAEIKYPEKCRDQKIQGRVVLKFVVDKNGRIKQVTNLKDGVDPLLVKEAIRVVSAMPKWNPGMNNGEAVNTEFVLPIVFQL
jgi:TonB family protein